MSENDELNINNYLQLLSNFLDEKIFKNDEITKKIKEKVKELKDEALKSKEDDEKSERDTNWYKPDEIFTQEKILCEQDLKKLDNEIIHLSCEKCNNLTEKTFEQSISCINEITNNINDLITKLNNGEKKKIFILAERAHAIGVVIGRNLDGKSYLFIDRYNSQKNYFGCSSIEQLKQQEWFKEEIEKQCKIENNLFYEKLNVDKIIATTDIQADMANCFIYSYIYDKIFANSVEADELVAEALKSEEKIYDPKDITKMPFVIQLLYQRNIKSEEIKKRFDKNPVILNKINEINKKITNLLGVYFSFINISENEAEDTKDYNSLLPFLGLIAIIDFDKFKEIVDEFEKIIKLEKKLIAKEVGKKYIEDLPYTSKYGTHFISLSPDTKQRAENDFKYEIDRINNENISEEKKKEKIKIAEKDKEEYIKNHPPFRLVFHQMPFPKNPLRWGQKFPTDKQLEKYDMLNYDKEKCKINSTLFRIKTYDHKINFIKKINNVLKKKIKKQGYKDLKKIYFNHLKQEQIKKLIKKRQNPYNTYQVWGSNNYKNYSAIYKPVPIITKIKKQTKQGKFLTNNIIESKNKTLIKKQLVRYNYDKNNKNMYNPRISYYNKLKVIKNGAMIGKNDKWIYNLNWNKLSQNKR